MYTIKFLHQKLLLLHHALPIFTLRPYHNLTLMELSYKILLEKAEIIRIRQQGLTEVNNFNIFRILRQESDEVNLHSRFIYELLNPNGSHGKGNIFLGLFAKICNLSLSYDTVQVKREYSKIDLLIQDNKNSVIIENKIWAGDQFEQLKRYHTFIKSDYRDTHLFYLTLNGDEPSEWSTGNLEAKITTISYSKTIDDWLTACLKESATSPILRETIVQYQNLIRHLSGKAMCDIEKKAVIELLAQDNNTESAAVIARNWRHVQWQAEYNFWIELLAIAKSSYTVLDRDLFNDSWIDKMVNNSRGKYADYGIILVIGHLFDKPVEFKLGRGWENLYYGFFHSSEELDIRNRAIRSIQHLGTEADEYWTGYVYNNLGLDLNDFDYSTLTQKLANKTKRQEIVHALWAEMQSFISKAALSYSKEFGDDFQLLNLN